jgi:signal peptidase I
VATGDGWLARKAPGLHRFLTRRDGKWPLLREGLAVLLVLGLAVGLLYGLTGQGVPFGGGTPVVVVTTGSMMHCAGSYPEPGPQHGKDCPGMSWGRIGTIDPGDLVFVQKVRDAGDVETAAEGRAGTYGSPGDVLVYKPFGQARTPIIHRAIFYLEIHADGTFSVPEYGIGPVRDLRDPRLLALAGCDATEAARGFHHAYGALPGHGSGFVTRGDNNSGADPCGSLGIARLDWVLGRARGEVPWIGLVNLLFGDLTSGSTHFGDAPNDSKAMFFVVAGLVLLAPWLLRLVSRLVRGGRRDEA